MIFKCDECGCYCKLELGLRDYNVPPNRCPFQPTFVKVSWKRVIE